MISRKILYILIVFLSMLFMIFYSKYFPVILFIELLVLPIILAVIMLCISKKLSIKIQSQNEFSSKNKETNIKLYINNLSRFPLSKADINVVYEDSLGNKIEKIIRVSIDGDNYRDINYLIIPDRCGVIKVYVNNIRVYDYFSLFSKRKKIYIEDKVLVLPNEHIFMNEILNYEELMIQESEKYSENEKGDDPSQIFDIREYMEGDKLQRVHWKLSSKYDELMVKEFSKPVIDSTVLLVELFYNNKKGDELIDSLIDTVYSISKHLISLGYPHYLAWHNNKNGMMKKEIVTNEDLFEAIRCILESKIYNNDIYALREYVSLTNEKNRNKLIYLSTNLDKRVTNELEKLDTASDNKMILLTSLEGAEIAFDLESNINISTINIDSFDESLDRLII